MLQRNDTGETRMFPTLIPPFEVADGETVDHPVRLGGLTLVGPRGRVIKEDEPEQAEPVDEFVNPADKPADQLPGAFAQTKDYDQAAADKAAEELETLKASVEAKTDEEVAVDAAHTGGVTPAKPAAKKATKAATTSKAKAGKTEASTEK